MTVLRNLALDNPLVVIRAWCMKSSMRGIMRKIKTLLVQALVKDRRVPLEPDTSFMDSPGLRGRLIDELGGRVVDVFPSINHEEATTWVTELFTIYPARPVQDNTFGSGFHNLFWLYVVGRMLKPQMIVESGVWKGLATWFLRQAAPAAQIYAFDVDLTPRRYKDAAAIYHECDWAKVDVRPGTGAHLAFFDCHVSHAQRILEAHKRGFRYLLLDDDLPLHKLFSARQPPFPTLSVVMQDDTLPNERITYQYRNQSVTYSFDAEEAAQARRLVQEYITLPDVGGPTKYGGFSFLTFARLRDLAMDGT